MFSHPRSIIQATRVDAVREAIGRAEAARSTGAWVAGFVTYEAAPAFDMALTTRPAGRVPLVWFGVFDGPDPAAVDPPDDPGTPATSTAPTDWTPNVSVDKHRSDLSRIRAAIEAGDTYQTNYTFRLHRSFIGADLHGLYRRLLAAHRPPFAASLAIGDWHILSLSPELFFQLQGRTLTTRPMKGTATRGRFAGEDDDHARALRRSAKDRAENVMIVDLMRNDLARIAEVGSVRVADLFAVERYRSVLQMTSTVTATVRADVDVAEIFAALFPAGSITGAPKASTMRLLSELEDTPRGIYCGAIGMLAPDGGAIFNVAIRTAVVDTRSGAAEFGVGGAVTWDSTAKAEYAEAWNKAGVLDAGPPVTLVETLRLDRGRLLRRDHHLDRLRASARYFGSRFDAGAIEDQLDAFERSCPDGVHRVRLLLSSSGTLAIESERFDPEPAASTPRPVCLARSAVDSSDVRLFHKTTERAVYDRRRAERPEVFDVLLSNERGEITEFTIGNVVVDLEGRLVTPPVTCGLLGGVFRGILIRSGAVTERVITTDEARRASRLWLVNSLREWVPVLLAP